MSENTMTTNTDAVPMPCPMCNASLSDASASGYHYHPANGCIFSGFEVSLDDISAWNRRVPATQADHIADERKMVAAWRDVLAERQRQVSVKGWTHEHDDEHPDGDMAVAAACYSANAGGVPWAGETPPFWPWCNDWWKPTTPRRDLVKAGALILAEIERIDRAASSTGDQEMGA